MVNGFEWGSKYNDQILKLKKGNLFKIKYVIRFLINTFASVHTLHKLLLQENQVGMTLISSLKEIIKIWVPKISAAMAFI